jgi:alkaline phosphatase
MVIESTSLRRGVGRRSLLSGVAATSALIASGGLPQVAGAQATPVVIKCLPIDRSTILAGSRFDLRVEVAGAQPDKIEVTVNGRDADAYFGTPGARTTETAGKSGEVTWRQVSVSVPGPVAVQVVATAGGRAYADTFTWTVLRLGEGRAKNVILFISDGMGYPTVTATRIVSRGITEGKYDGFLYMDRMEYRGTVTTSGYDTLVTDSANSASAYATGHKSVNNAMGVYEDNTKDTLDDPKVENLIELVKRTRKMATGLVSTADITDATPAAFAAHTRRRSDQAFVAATYLEEGHRPDVILGGGSRWFLPKAQQGASLDDRDLVAEFRAAGYAVAATRAEMKAAPATASKMLGLFHTGNMSVWYDREETKDATVLGKFTDQPNLPEMTGRAIDALALNPNGFFLMVEAGSVDKQLHPMDWMRAIYDNIEFDNAIGVARKFQEKHPDTLIVVTADHSHAMSITGTYTPQPGKVGADAVGTYANSIFPTFTHKRGDGFPDSPTTRTTLAVGWGNHPEYYDDGTTVWPAPVGPAIEDPKAKGTFIANPDRITGTGAVLHPRTVPADVNSEVHTADDVPVMASGPGSEFFNGLLDNTDLFYGMAAALGVDPLSSNGRSPMAKITGGRFGDPANPASRDRFAKP